MSKSRNQVKSVNFCQTIRRHISEASTLHSYRHEILKSDDYQFVCDSLGCCEPPAADTAEWLEVGVTSHDNNKHVSVLVSRNLKHQLLLARSPLGDRHTGTLQGHTLSSYPTEKMLTCDCINEQVSPLKGRRERSCALGRVGELRL
jgi:hypothetical protein